MLVYTRRESASGAAEPEPPTLAAAAVETRDAEYRAELSEFAAKCVSSRGKMTSCKLIDGELDQVGRGRPGFQGVARKEASDLSAMANSSG